MKMRDLLKSKLQKWGRGKNELRRGGEGVKNLQKEVKRHLTNKDQAMEEARDGESHAMQQHTVKVFL